MCVLHSLVLGAVLLGAGCGDDDGPSGGDRDGGPGVDAGGDAGLDEEPFALQLVRVPAAHAGEIHDLILRGPGAAPDTAFRIERSCDGAPFADLGIALDGQQPSASVPAPIALAPPAAAEVTEAVRALAEIHRAMSALTPFAECRGDATCGPMLAALEADAAPIAMRLDDALGRLVPADTPPDVILSGCVYHGVPEGGGPVVDFQEGIPGIPGSAPYASWTSPVSDPRDPCHGRTPLDCYGDRIGQWRRRVCGELRADGTEVVPPPDRHTLPQPNRDICRALYEGWVTFEEPSCEPLDRGAAGRTRPRPTTPTGLPDGRTSGVLFCAESFARGACSYGTYFHEMIHVILNARWPRWAELDAALAAELAAANALRRARDRQRMVLEDEFATMDDHGAVIDEVSMAADAFDAAHRAAQTIILERALEQECAAFGAQFDAIDALGAAAPRGEGVSDAEHARAIRQWKKDLLWIFLEEMPLVLDSFDFATLSDEARTAACTCIDRIRGRAMNVFPGPGTEDLWTCMSDWGEDGEHPPDRYDALSARLMCP